MTQKVYQTRTNESHIVLPVYPLFNHSDEQGSLFDTLMQHVFALQGNISTSQSIIIYKSNSESGLGNIIIGMVSSLIAGLATNRGFQSRY